MAKISSFSKLFLAFGGLIASLAVSAQTIQYLNANNIIGGVAIGGNLFSDSIIPDAPMTQVDLFQTKFDSGRSEIFTDAIWLTGLDSNGNLHCAANRYFDYGRDFFDGPIAPVYDSNYDGYYKRVWKVTQEQISEFRALQFPANPSQVDSSILYWPGKGNPSVLSNYSVNISSTLAPFVDLNNNGIYEPLLGDYPGICGNQGVFFVFNDIRGPHTETNGAPFGVEIRGLASAYVDSSLSLPYGKRAVNNTVFVQYEIENKSANNYSSFDLGPWLDPDIGCFSNDMIGCDTTRGMMFAYNGTTDDPDCAPELGYNYMPVALGVKLLNQPMDVFGGFYLSGLNDSAAADPVSALEYRLNQEGYWRTDSPFTIGGNGYNGNNADSTKFIFSGDPNDTNQWSEIQANVAPSDVRMFGSTNHLNFTAGEIIHFDYAFFTSYDTTSGHLSIIDTAKRDADIIQAFYNNTILPCQSQLALGINETLPPDQYTVLVYPNPANDKITIAADVNIQSIELMDVEGRIILCKTVGALYITLPVAYLAKGVYLVNVQSEAGSIVKKIVIE